MNVAIFGATGMVGKGVLLECLDDARVARVLLVSRQHIDISHPKLHEIVHLDFFDFSATSSRSMGIRSLYPLLRRVLPQYVTTTVNIGRAMIEVAERGYSKQILFSPDINRLASRS